MKTPTEILSQLERVEYRYKRYNTLYAYQIRDILDAFKIYEYDEAFYQEHRIGDDKWNINKEKIQKISQDKLHRNLNALKEFNEDNSTKRGIVEYLYTCISRSQGYNIHKRKISLVHPHSFPKIKENIDLLEEVGFSGEELNRYLIHTMHWVRRAYLNYTPQRNKSHLDRLKNDVGLSDEQIRMFLHQASSFFYNPLGKYQDKLSCLQSCAKDPWDCKEKIATIISWFPHCLNCSEEKILKTARKIQEINADFGRVLVQYPQLFYFNPETEFFRRLVLWLGKWHKRYQRIVKRIQERFSYEGAGENYIKPPLSEEKYLDGLRIEEHKRSFLFNPEESKKSFPKYRDHAFAECQKYLSKKEQDFIKEVYEKDQEGKILSEQEKRVFLTLMEKRIKPKDQQLYSDFVKIFTYKESIKSRLREENDDYQPF